MCKYTAYLRKSTNPKKKWMVTLVCDKHSRRKTIHFGAAGMSDYTKHTDKARKERYISRHRKRENWTKSGVNTAGFWSRWLLWGEPSLSSSKSKITSKFGVKIVNGNPPKK